MTARKKAGCPETKLLFPLVGALALFFLVKRSGAKSPALFQNAGAYDDDDTPQPMLRGDSGVYDGDPPASTSTRTEVRSPTSTRTEVRSPTSTTTDAYTQGNITVTGGAGNGATTTVYVNPRERT